MTEHSGVTLKWSQLLAAGLFLLALGGAVTYVATHQATAVSVVPAASSGAPATSRSAHTDQSRSEGPLPDVAIALSSDAIQRAGLEVVSVQTISAAGAGSQQRVPGIVQPNAYRSVKVTPLTAGRVTRVPVELGSHVRRGQPLAEIYSPELSEAETRFLSAKAALDAHERMLQRTAKLVEIGAAARQELEQVHAEHAAATTTVESARARLTLLGLTEQQIASLGSSSSAATLVVPSPIDGVVTERQANTGANVDIATPLFTVVDLSTVWIVGNLYERDFGRIHVGSPVTVTSTAYSDLRLQARVSYVDPQVNAESRTAQVRVEVPNRNGELKLGMYVDMSVGSGQRSEVVAIPRTAVQMVGERSVVYLAAPEGGRFVEREVKLGENAGEKIAVLSGVQAGDRVVTKGSFTLRAERERLGLRAAASPGNESRGQEMKSPTPSSPTEDARVLVTEQGYEPAKMTVRQGAPARITFVRTTDKTCGTEVVFPSLNIRRLLPLNVPVVIEFTPTASGSIGFVCGMNMLRGTIVIE